MFKVEFIVLFKPLKWTNNSTSKWTNKSTAILTGQNPASNYFWSRYNRRGDWQGSTPPYRGFLGEKYIPFRFDNGFELTVHHINYPGWSRIDPVRTEPRFYESIGRWCLPLKSVPGRNSLTIFMVVIPTEEVTHASLRHSNVQSYRPEMF